MMPMDTPANYQQERMDCSIQAAQHYHIPALVMLAVVEQEGGKPGECVRNDNGTYDYGSMQINTAFLDELKAYGIREKHVLAKGCYPYELAAWRLAGHLRNDQGDLWQRAANYHSRTPYYNQIYRNRLQQRAASIAHRLHLSKMVLQMDINSTLKMGEKTPSVKSDQRLQVHSAYVAPIRVNGFDHLETYSFQFKSKP
jgi:hypothetical protein